MQAEFPPARPRAPPPRLTSAVLRNRLAVDARTQRPQVVSLPASSPPQPTFPLRRLWPLAFCFVASVLLRGVFVLEPPGRDQGLFMTQAGLFLDGHRLYADIWEHKPPGVILAYAAAMAVLGRDAVAMHALGWLAGFLTALALWGLVEQATQSRRAALLASGLYLLFQQHPVIGGFWSIAQAEVLMDPCVAGALWLLYRREPTDRPQLRLLGIGSLAAGILLLKYSALPMAAGLALLALQRFRRPLPTAAWLLAGAVLPFLVLGGYLLAVGAWDAFYTATVAFNRVHRLIGVRDRTQDIVGQILWRWLSLRPLYLGLFAGLVALGWQRWRRIATPPVLATQHLFAVALVLWACALAEVFWQGKFWNYQYNVVLLPLCLAAVSGLALLTGLWPTRRRLTRALVVLGVAVTLVPTVALSWSYAQEHRLAERWRGDVSWMQFWSTYRWNGPDYDYAEDAIVAAEVTRRTKPGDAIFVWGFEPAVYLLSGRAPASRFLYDYPLAPQFTAVRAQFLAELLADFARTPPQLFLVVHNDRSRIEPKESAAQLDDCPEVKAYLTQHFVAAGRLGDFDLYQRKP